MACHLTCVSRMLAKLGSLRERLLMRRTCTELCALFLLRKAGYDSPFDDDDDDDDDDDNNNRIQRRCSRFFFYNLLTAPRTVSNTYAQVAQAQSCPNHVQHIERLSRATCRVTCHLVQRNSSAVKFDRVEIASI